MRVNAFILYLGGEAEQSSVIWKCKMKGSEKKWNKRHRTILGIIVVYATLSNRFHFGWYPLSLLISQIPFYHAILFPPIFSHLLYSFCVSYHFKDFFLVLLAPFKLLYQHLFPCTCWSLMIKRYERACNTCLCEPLLKFSYFHSLCWIKFYSCVCLTLTLSFLVSSLLIPFDGYFH